MDIGRDEEKRTEVELLKKERREREIHCKELISISGRFQESLSVRAEMFLSH